MRRAVIELSLGFVASCHISLLGLPRIWCYPWHQEPIPLIGRFAQACERTWGGQPMERLLVVGGRRPPDARGAQRSRVRN